jgi:hypothetical protein
MQSKLSRKEIQETIEVSLNTALERLKITDPSKRIRKISKKASHKLSGEIKSELKKLSRKFQKEQKAVNGGNAKIKKNKETRG